MTAELDPLDAVIDRIRRSAPPADGWARARRRAARRRWRPALAVVAALLVIGGFAMLIGPQRGEQPVPLPLVLDPLPEVVRAPDPPPPAPPPRGGMAGVYRSPRKAVAASAPVIVSTADAAPLKLGGTVPAGHVGPRIHVWDWEKSDTSRVLDATCEEPFAVTPDGKQLLTTEGRRIDLTTGKAEPLAWWGERKLRPAWLQFAPDGKTMLAFEHDQKTGNARLLDYPAGTERARIGGLWRAASKAAFTADCKSVVLYGTDAHLRSFDATTGKEKVRFAPGFENTIAAIAVSPDGSRVAGAQYGVVRVWDAATGRLVCEPTTKGDGPLSWVDALAFSPDGKRLAGGGTGRLTLWDAADGSLVHRYPAESIVVADIRFDPTGTTITTVKGIHIHGPRGGGDVTVYPTVDRWRTDAPERAGPKK